MLRKFLRLFFVGILAIFQVTITLPLVPIVTVVGLIFLIVNRDFGMLKSMYGGMIEGTLMCVRTWSRYVKSGDYKIERVH